MVDLGELTDEYDAADYLREVDARRALLDWLWAAEHASQPHPMPMPCFDDERRIKELHRLLKIPETKNDWSWIIAGGITGLIIGIFVFLSFAYYYGGGSLG